MRLRPVVPAFDAARVAEISLESEHDLRRAELRDRNRVGLPGAQYLDVACEKRTGETVGRPGRIKNGLQLRQTGQLLRREGGHSPGREKELDIPELPFLQRLFMEDAGTEIGQTADLRNLFRRIDILDTFFVPAKKYGMRFHVDS